MNLNITGNTYPVRDQLRALGCKWNPADKCWVAKNEATVEKAREIVGNQGPFNSPPPPDFGPIDDLVGACAKYNRVPVEGAKLVQLRIPSPKGAQHMGTLVQGKYLVLSAGRAQYYSRDYLEDMDLFHMRPGYYVSAQAVAVLPAEAEAKAAAEKKAKEESRQKAEARRQEIQNLVQKLENNKDDAQWSTPDMVKLWGFQNLAGHDLMWSNGERLVYEISSHDGDFHVWLLANPELATEALTLKTEIRNN